MATTIENSNLMNIDKQFVAELHDLDDRLNLGWNEKKERWQIVRESNRMKYIGKFDGRPLFNSYMRLSHVMTVQNEDGSYRPLDGRIIEHLREIDLWRFSRTSDFWRKIEQDEEDYKTKKARQQSEYIQELTKENYSRIHNAIEQDSYGGYGKG